MQPYVYVSGGMLGDFIQQLSVIQEVYMKEKRKGILYIAPIGDYFKFGIEKAYEDTYPFIIKQEYIEDYKIYNNENHDVNLSAWRTCGLVHTTSWTNIFKHTYNIDWGKNRWLYVDTDDKYKDTVFISCSFTRSFPNIDYNILFSPYEKDKVIFLTQNMDEYTNFNKLTGYELNVLVVKSLEEMVIAINSCKLFIGSLSSPLTIAHSLHKDTIVLLRPPSVDYATIHMKNISDVLPNTKIVYTD